MGHHPAPPATKRATACGATTLVGFYRSNWPDRGRQHKFNWGTTRRLGRCTEAVWVLQLHDAAATAGREEDHNERDPKSKRHRYRSDHSSLRAADRSSERLEVCRFRLAGGLHDRADGEPAARHRARDRPRQSGRSRPRRSRAPAFRAAVAAPGHRRDPPPDRGGARFRRRPPPAGRGVLEKRSRHALLGDRHASRARAVAERARRPARPCQGFQPRGPARARLPQQAEGDLQLYGTRIGADLDLSGANFAAETAVRLRIVGADIKGALKIHSLTKSPKTEMQISDTSCAVLDDRLEAWRDLGRLDLDGFAYRRIRDPDKATFRVDWLRLQLPVDKAECHGSFR